MEKGFNDEELAYIMSEIESLEQEFVQDVAKDEKESEPVAQQHEEPVKEEPVAEQHDEPVAEQHEEPEEVVAQEEHESQPEETEVEDAFDDGHEEVVAHEEVKEDKVQPIHEVKEPISEQEANVHASIQANHQESVDHSADGEMNEVLDELSQMPVDDVTPAHNKQDDNVHHFKGEEKVGQKSNQTAMSFHVEGDMKLELSFHIGDQFIGVNITDQGLEVGLEGGAKFTIPVQPQAQQKKAA